MFPKETAFTLCDLLIKKEPGSTRGLDELDMSALKELGNIVAGNYLTVLSNVVGAKIVEHIPSFSFDMFGAILEQIVAEFARDVRKAIVIEVEFIFKPETLKGYYLLLFESDSFKRILG